MVQAIPIGVRHLPNKGLILPNEDQTLKNQKKKNLNSRLQKCRNSNIPNPIFQGANLALPRHPSIPSHPDALPKATDKTPWHPQRFPGSNVWMCAICVWTYRVKECQRCFPKSMHFRCVFLYETNTYICTCIIICVLMICVSMCRERERERFVYLHAIP